MKKVVVLFTVLLAMIFCSCQQKEVNIVDREGNQVMLKPKLERIISSAPSNTEILVALGLGDKIVAVDNYSPLEGLKEDVTKVDFVNPDPEIIVGLNPDIIIASGHNKVGAEDPFAVIKEAGISVVYIPSPSSIDEIFLDIAFISEITGTKEKGDAIITEMKQEIAKIKAIGETIQEKKKVYFEISPAPYIYSTGRGTFQNEIIELIGAKNIFGQEEGWLSASAEVIVERNPDVIITNVNFIENSVQELLNREGFSEVTAIKGKKVFLIDANASSRPSQNVLNAIKEMAKVVYPEYYE